MAAKKVTEIPKPAGFTMTVQQLLLASDTGALLHLINQPFASATSALKLHRIWAFLKGEVDSAQKAKLQLFTPENSIDMAGGAKRLKPAYVEQVLADPLFSQEVTIPLPALTEEDLEGVKLSAAHIENLGPILKL